MLTSPNQANTMCLDCSARRLKVFSQSNLDYLAIVSGCSCRQGACNHNGVSTMLKNALAICHSERSEESRSEGKGNTRFLVAVAPRNDTDDEFFNILLELEIGYHRPGL
jgi:hypothetical protein